MQTRQKTLAIVAALGVGLLVGDNLVFTPLVKAWNNRQDRIRQLDDAISKGQALLQQEERLKSYWTNMRTNALPAKGSDAESKVLQAISRWEAASHLTLNGRTPQWKQLDEEYSTLEIRADGVGNLPAVARFLFELEKETLALKIEDFDLTAKDPGGQQLTMALRFTGLQFAGDIK